MIWWLVVFTSAGLIALGVTLLLRDIFRARTNEPARATTSTPVSTGVAARTWPRARALIALLPAMTARRLRLPVDTTAARATNPAHGQGSASPDAADGQAQTARRLPSLERQWPRLAPEINRAVVSVNQTMGPLALAVGSPGEATWSLHNEGFGCYRRVLIDNASVGWLRLEIGSDLRLTARFRSHDAEHANVNRDSVAPSRRTENQLAQTLTESLAGVFEYAVWRHSNIIRNDGAPQPPPVTAPAVVAAIATAPRTVRTTTIEPRSARGDTLPAPPPPRVTALGSPAAALVDAAIALVNQAFADAGAQLHPAESHPAQGSGAPDRALSIVARGVPVGLMLIEPRADRIEISVGVADPANLQAARRQSQPMTGLTVHALAEAIATNAWPAIACTVSNVS